jgi:hypothetical protein
MVMNFFIFQLYREKGYKKKSCNLTALFYRQDRDCLDLGNGVNGAYFDAFGLIGAFFRVDFHVLIAHGNGALGALYFAGSANNAIIRNYVGHYSVPFGLLFCTPRS